MTPPAPVLVLAPPGLPGATVAAALGRHPAALGLPEINLVLAPLVDDALVEMSGLRGMQLHGTLRALAHLLAGEQSGEAVAMARRWLARRAHLHTGPAWAEILALAAPRRVVAPVTAALFQATARRRLAEALPLATLVLLRSGEEALAALLRDPATRAAASLLGAGEEGAEPSAPDVQRLAAEAMLDLLERAPGSRVEELQLEALVADPERELGRIATGLGWPLAADDRAAMLQPERSPFAGPGPFGAHGGGGVPSFADIAARLAGAAAQAA